MAANGSVEWRCRPTARGAPQDEPALLRARGEILDEEGHLPRGGGGQAREQFREQDVKLAQVGPSWANPLSMYSNRNAWANLHLLGQANIFLAFVGVPLLNPVLP
jgi:hypothetical protein